MDMEYLIYQNSIFLLKYDELKGEALYQEPRASVFKNSLQTFVSRATTSVIGLILVNSAKEASPLREYLNHSFGGTFELHQVSEFADLIALRRLIRIFLDSNVDVIDHKGEMKGKLLIIPSPILLYIFCMGLVRLGNFDFICFDNVRNSTGNRHPYNVFMEVFFTKFD